MNSKSQELININDARNCLNSEGLAHLASLVYSGRTVNIGSRMYISKRQLNNCLKKDGVLHRAITGVG